MRKIVLGCLMILFAGLAIHWYIERPVEAQALTFDTGQISCTNSATALVSAVRVRTGLLITNVGTVAVYIGNASVATNTGSYLPGGVSVSIPTRDAVYCISSGANQTVTFAETYGTF